MIPPVAFIFGRVDSPENADFILASVSPRRQQLLTDMRARFVVVPAHIDETPEPDECPRAYVLRMACGKADKVYRSVNCPGSNNNRKLPVLGADTAVVAEQIFGKPESEEDALAMLMALSGRMHHVLTAIALVYEDGPVAPATGSANGKLDSDTGELRCESRLVESEVTFRTLSEAECLRYWQSGEPEGKAGGYAIQGLGGLFVTRINGSYSGVVGLPVAETYTLLNEFNIPCGLSW